MPSVALVRRRLEEALAGLGGERAGKIGALVTEGTVPAICTLIGAG